MYITIIIVAMLFIIFATYTLKKLLSSKGLKEFDSIN